MILQKQIARLVGFATCGSPRGSRNGKKAAAAARGGSGLGVGT